MSSYTMSRPYPELLVAIVTLALKPTPFCLELSRVPISVHVPWASWSPAKNHTFVVCTTTSKMRSKARHSSPGSHWPIYNRSLLGAHQAATFGTTVFHRAQYNETNAFWTRSLFLIRTTVQNAFGKITNAFARTVVFLWCSLFFYCRSYDPISRQW